MTKRETMSEPINYALKTRGGSFGYLVRRFIHIAIFVIPLIYYAYGKSIAAAFYMTPTVLLWCLIGVVVILEVMRLCFGWLAFGQREHEAKQISSFAWAAVSIFFGVIICAGRSLCDSDYLVVCVWRSTIRRAEAFPNANTLDRDYWCVIYCRDLVAVYGVASNTLVVGAANGTIDCCL